VVWPAVGRWDRLAVHPVVLGSGLALFDGTAPFDHTLTDVTSFPIGTQGLVCRTK
jgi:hypothetical protein